MAPRPGRADREAVEQGGGRLRPGARRDRRDGPPPLGRRLPARRHPLPPRARQRRHDPRATSSGAERVVCVGGSYIGSRGRRLADRARQEGHDRHAGGRAARAPVRRPGRRVLPLGPRGSRDRDRRRRRDRCTSPARATATRVVARRAPPAAARSTAEAVVCGVGALPDVMLARKAGLTLGELGGVLCDSRAAHVGRARLRGGRHLRVRERRPRPRHAHRARGGRRRPGRDRRPQHARRRRPARRRALLLLRSQRLGGLEYAGPAIQWDQEVVRGSLDDGAFAIWYLEADRVRAMLSVGGAGDIERANELIAAGEAVGAAGVPE